MHEPRFDVMPLPIAELAPIHFASSDPDEPFALGSDRLRVTGSCGLTVSALNEFAIDRATPVYAVITPCGVVRTARVRDVVVSERVAILATPPAVISQWSVERDAVLQLIDGSSFEMRGGGTLTLASGVDDRTAIERAFRTTATSVTRALQHALRVEGDGLLGGHLDWATARLALERRQPELPVRLAALVAGDASLVLEDAPSELLPLLAARYAATTGDLNGLAPLRERLRDATASFDSAPADDRIAVIRLAGLTELQRTAIDFGDHDYAADLRATARRAAAELGSRPLDPVAAAMHAALRTAEPLSAPRPVTTDDVSAHAWQTWAALESGRLHDGFAGFERLSAEAELPVRGAWPGRFAQLDADPTATALFACTCAYGLVGIEPDAARHRLRIRPRLSARPGHTVVRGIRCGDATVSLEIVTEPDVVTIDVRQDDGAIPLTALLEPVLAAPVTTATVDHRPASLDISPLGDGFVVPVQLILDDVRSLRLKLANN